MKEHVTIGVACLARKTFDFDAAREIYQHIQEDLQRIENVTFEFIPELVFEVPDAEQAGQEFATKDLDGIVLIAGTFHLGHLALVINKIVKKPILLWGLNELPYNGGKIRLNSVCGINLDASNLYKGGVKDYHVVIGASIDEAWIDALRVKHAFSKANIGIAGYRAHGFFNLDIDEPDLYRATGAMVDHFELAEIFDIEVTTERVAAMREKIEATFTISALSEEQIDKVSILAAKLEAFVAKNKLTALAIRCWPEFAATFGIAPCAAMSLLQAGGTILACEGDILGALSMLAHVAIGAETPFLADFSQVNLEENFALLWHCGVAPCNLWNGACEISLETYHAGGKGVTADFVLKAGEMSIARIDYCQDGYRLFLQEAKAIPMDKELKGTYAKVVFDGSSVRDVLDKIVMNGIAHHVSVVYGKFIKPLEILARLLGWTVIK
ncbi:MAG TPA: fucose isomerase [Candidatus Lokiarchaeia archaeon]|nr:fucose isomerase [Candidatus Lokiarchaeia archaeon]